MSTRWVLLGDRLLVVGFALLAAWNFDTGNHSWFAFWVVYTILALIDYAHDVAKPKSASKVTSHE